MAKQILSVRVDEDLIQRLDALADATGQSRAEVMDRVLTNGIEHAERFVKQFDSPILRAGWGVLSSPAVLRALSELVGETMTEPELQRINKRVAVLKARKGGKHGGRPATA